MIRYDQKLSAEMQADHTSILNGSGVSVQVKKIPDEPRAGHYDPREYTLCKAQADFFAKSASGPKKEFTIDDVRKAMGFPNLNMNTVEIYTKYEEHIFEGNTVGIWIYYPRKPEGKTGRPGFIYIHGGGWVGGTPYTVENPCRLLAERADCVVFNIDYSLAPEKPYPNAFNDCYGALRYIYGHAEQYGVDRSKLGMGGDSAGGNLTAAIALKDRDTGSNMLKYQALIYPAVTLADDDVPGYHWDINEFEMCEEQRALIEPGLQLGRPKEDGKTPDNMYLQHGEDPHDPYISPMFAKSHRGLCKALIAVAEFDGLRLQGEYYGKMLRDAGVEARIIRYKGVGHAFLDKLGFLPQAEDLVQEMANDIVKL